MTNPDAWKRIKKVAEQRRDVSARDLASLLTRANEEQEKLNLLLGYRDDYRARFESASRAGIHGESLRNYQRFLANLEQAVAQQNQTLGMVRLEVAQARQRVAGEQRRTESYQVIDDRRSTVAFTREVRLAQTLQDEIATRVVPQFAPSHKT